MQTAHIRDSHAGQRHALSIGIALLGLFSGCDRGATAGRPPLHTASGQVTVAGKPAAGVVISLHSLASAETGQLIPSATSDADGSFRISTYGPGDGAPAGEYSVTCVWPKSVSADAGEVDQLKGRYAVAAKSKLKFTIAEGANNLPPLHLK